MLIHGDIQNEAKRKNGTPIRRAYHNLPRGSLICRKKEYYYLKHRKDCKICYEYDFGDSWIHNIKLKRIIEDCSFPYPHCTEAIGDAPMENCGGSDGFAEVMKAMNDPEHPRHNEICAWVRSIWWHPVDLESINRRIRNEYRVCIPVCYE